MSSGITGDVIYILTNPFGGGGSPHRYVIAFDKLPKAARQALQTLHAQMVAEGVYRMDKRSDASPCVPIHTLQWDGNQRRVSYDCPLLPPFLHVLVDYIEENVPISLRQGSVVP